MVASAVMERLSRFLRLAFVLTRRAGVALLGWNRPQKRPVPIEIGKYHPHWSFRRKHGEQNCDGMVHRSSTLEPVNGAWVMCSRKFKGAEEATGLRFCSRHLKRRPALTCTSDEAAEILEELGRFNDFQREFFVAQEKTPYLWSLDKRQRQLEKTIRKDWGEAIDWLSKAVANGLECWEETFPDYEEGEFQLGFTLHMLHGQACALAEAIADHCRKGRIQSAIILWRSLFQIEVDMAFVAKGDTQVPSRAERYYDWWMANYFGVNGLPDHAEMIRLRRKYSGWKLRDYDGWAAPPDNPRASLDLTERAQRVGYTRQTKDVDRYSPLDVYTRCHSYVHNNMFAMWNDLITPRQVRRDGPTAVGLDVPLCLTAYSLTRATHLLLDSHAGEDGRRESLSFGRLAEIQESQVMLEVQRVRSELLSPLRGVDVFLTWKSKDGVEYIGRPARRGEP